VTNLDYLRASLLETAADDATRELERARAERAARVAEAHRQAETIVAEAHQLGEREGAAEVSHRLVRARREARRVVLAAQRAAFEDFRGRALGATLARRREPAYAALLERLSAAAREQLVGDGEGAAGRDVEVEVEVEVDPPDRGGVHARLGSRRVDYTLPALVDRVIAGLGTESRSLWE